MSSPFRKVWHVIVGLGIPLDALLSLVVAFTWVVIVSLDTGDIRIGLYGALYMLPPLVLIWFRDTISEFTGSFGFHQVNAESPPGLVAFFGWLGLIGIIWLSASELFK